MHGVIGRLQPTVILVSARADLESIAAALASSYPTTNAGWTVDIDELHNSIVADHRLGLMTLFAAVGCVMLIGCVNISSLVLVRGAARRRELSVRAALGASRARIVRLLFMESLALSIVGGMVGCAFAAILLPLLVEFAGDGVPRLTSARLSGAALGFCATIVPVTALIAGLLPALRLSLAGKASEVGREGERSIGLTADTRLQRLLVAGQLGICLVLVAGAMLFIQTFSRLRAVDLGFSPEHVVSIDTRVPIFRTLGRNRWHLLATDTTAALQHLRSIPGVQYVSATSDIPLSGDLLTTDVTFPTDPRPRQAYYHRVSPDYFRTMGMALVQGRDFNDDDASDLARIPNPQVATTRQGAVIVNETTAKTFWPGSEAIGQFLSTSFDARISRRQVVGVVRDARSETRRTAPPAEVYVPFLEDPSFAMTLLVRTALPPDLIVPTLRRTLRDVSKDLSTANVRMVDDVVADSLRPSRFGATVVTTFAIVALLLSAVGMFGVMAFTVAVRRREISIRVALGATRDDIVRMFMKQAAGPISAGVTIGALGVIATGRIIEALLFEVAPADPLSISVAVVLLVGVAFTASYLPIRRLVQTDPAPELHS